MAGWYAIQATSWTHRSVPAAGFGPAASRSSGGRSYHLSYTGLSTASGGTRTHCVRFKGAVLVRSSIAGLLQQPVLVSSQLDRGSEPQSPPEGLASRRSKASGGTRTHWVRFTGAVLGPSRIAGLRAGWPVGVEPTQSRFTAGPRNHFGFGHSAPTWNRTRNTAFAKPDDVPFTIEANRSVPRPGIEPGPALSERAMMSVSPSGQQAAGDGVEPSPSGVKARRSTAELPRHVPIPANNKGQESSDTWPLQGLALEELGCHKRKGRAARRAACCAMDVQ